MSKAAPEAVAHDGETLDDIAREVEPAPDAAPEPAGEPGPEPEASADPEAARRGMLVAIGGVVGIAGGIITTRAGVTPLTGEEVEALAGAAAEVAAQYDVGELSPRAAAWLGLGLAVLGVAAPRLDEFQAVQLARRRAAAAAVEEGEPEPEPEPVH